ncbi:AbrB/MazE/SpoVT family DNA-binding domain-containing protein [Candidatus Parcubacteria bacterium]|nr:AbrB/MazE/SpoVT family DNA-binding domain-containing protein [Candidatus Parcubacteria bacterium]
MSTKVQKWGNSLAVRLPKEVAVKFGLKEGAVVQIVPSVKNIILKPASRKRLTLRDLVGEITSKNRHDEISWGKPRGREVW